MALQVELWRKEIKEILFANNRHVLLSESHDALIKNKTVHIPQAGALPAVLKDPATFPLTVKQRTDTDHTYDLHQYALEPILKLDIDELQRSYDLRQSLLKHSIRALNDRLGLEALYAWAGAGLVAASGQIVLTTGTGKAAIAPPGGTGSVLGLMPVNIADAATKLDDENAPQENRYLSIPAKVYWDFVEINKQYLLNIDYNKGLSNEDIQTGVVSKVYGFKIIVRNYTCVYTDAATPTLKAVGAAQATSDVWGIVGWQSDCVARALGSIKPYFNENDPVYLGSIFNASVMFAAAKVRADSVGIVTIVQNT